MKKTKRKAAGGMLMRELSPAASIARSIQSGSPEGILNALPLVAGQAIDPKDGPALAQALKGRSRAVGRMAKGGRVRGDGVCQRGKTKGRMV